MKVAIAGAGSVGTAIAADLHAGGQVAGVALGKGRRRVHPWTARGTEAGGAQQAVAPDQLRADLAGDARLRQGGHVDGNEGLVEDLGAVRRRECAQRTQPAALVPALDRVHRGRVHFQRRGHVPVVVERGGYRTDVTAGHGQDDSHPQRTADTDGSRLLVGQKGREAGDRCCRVLAEQRDGDGVDVAAGAGAGRAVQIQRRPRSRAGGRGRRRRG